ncbi:MAG: 4-(cytidine 5'-diphospho)-2-C-methyl-D-erythritol kinase [Anaeroplasmataceae bacterium]|nr:4-(cytidine 5'-diphospho)-2-C-methyl-D-erythritol kinase [Anaeroplasmataceae bacterium]
MIYEKAYAKLNFALAVGKEHDGYHEVENLMVPISLYDELFFHKSEDVRIECEIEIKDNICLKAIQLFKEKFHISEGVTVFLNKNIPIMAGLAGGSSDAAATLRGLNRLFETNATKDELNEIACKLGSDVPFFLQNKAALCIGRGEIVHPIDADFKNISFLLIKPNFGLSTKEVYQNFKESNKDRTSIVKQIIEAANEKDIQELDQLIFNDLENVALDLSKELKVLFDKIDSLSYHPHISGSGPSIFILNAKTKDLENIRQLDSQLNLFLCHTI